jgi:hypothetical protein
VCGRLLHSDVLPYRPSSKNKEFAKLLLCAIVNSTHFHRLLVQCYELCRLYVHMVGQNVSIGQRVGSLWIKVSVDSKDTALPSVCRQIPRTLV